jgi:hypothetical protein
MRPSISRTLRPVFALFFDGLRMTSYDLAGKLSVTPLNFGKKKALTFLIKARARCF